MAFFVEELGVTGKAVPFYAGIAVASSSVTSAIMSPIWGSLADRFGRKPMMLRASIAMTLTMGGIAFVPSVFWLLVLRLLNGVFSGFVPNSTALIASQVPKDQSGYALGTLSTGVVAGTLMGPLIGGFIAENLGMRNVFLFSGFPFDLLGDRGRLRASSKRRTKIQLGIGKIYSAKRYSLGPLFNQYDHSNDRPIYLTSPATLCEGFRAKK